MDGMVDDARKRDTMMLCILRPNHIKSKHGRYDGCCLQLHQKFIVSVLGNDMYIEMDVCNVLVV